MLRVFHWHHHSSQQPHLFHSQLVSLHRGSSVTFCASSFFSCLRRSVRLMSFSMASTCLLRCFRYMPQARQYDSSSRPKRWLTVLLCISDLLEDCSSGLTGNVSHSFKKKKKEKKKDSVWTYFKCQKKKCPILWLVNALFKRKRASGLSRYCSYLRTWAERSEEREIENSTTGNEDSVSRVGHGRTWTSWMRYWESLSSVRYFSRHFTANSRIMGSGKLQSRSSMACSGLMAGQSFRRQYIWNQTKEPYAEWVLGL